MNFDKRLNGLGLSAIIYISTDIWVRKISEVNLIINP